MRGANITERDGAVFGLRDVEIRQSGNGKDWTMTGLAAVYEQLSEPLVTPFGRFREKLARGAFTDVLAEKPDVRLLFNHDENYVLARTRSGTLELKETDAGLRIWGLVAPTGWALDLRESIQRGDVDQMSFAFTVEDDEWEDKEDGAVIRTITKVRELFDVSVVTFAAYPQTSAAARSLERALAAGLVSGRKVISFRETPKAPADTPWDGKAEVSRADTDDLRAMCAWCDTSGDLDEDGWPTAKGAYKLPHHRSDGSHPVVWRGVVAAMNALLRPAGTPRAVAIPKADRKGVYDHLARHYEQFDREPPTYERALTFSDLATRDLADPNSLSAEERETLGGLWAQLAFGEDRAGETTTFTLAENGPEIVVPATSTTSASVTTTNIARGGILPDDEAAHRVASPDEGEGTETDAPDDPEVEERNAARDEPADDPKGQQLEALKIDVRRRVQTLTSRIGRSHDGGEASGRE